MKLKSLIASGPDRERVFGEIWHGHRELLDVSHEEAGCFEVGVFFRERDGSNKAQVVEYHDLQESFDDLMRALLFEPGDYLPEPTREVLTVESVPGEQGGRCSVRVWHRDHLFAHLYENESGEIVVKIYPHPTEEWWTLPGEELSAALKDAREALEP